MSLLSLEEAFRQDMQQDGGNASNNNNSAPLPSDAALALVNFLKYELTPQAAVLLGPHGHVFEESSEEFTRLCGVFPRILELVFGVERRILVRSSGMTTGGQGGLSRGSRDYSSSSSASKIVMDAGLLNRNLFPNWGQAESVLFGSAGGKRNGKAMVVVPKNARNRIERDVLVKLLTPTMTAMTNSDGSSIPERQPQHQEQQNIITLFDAAVLMERQFGGAAKFSFSLKSLPEPSKLLLKQMISSIGGSHHQQRESEFRWSTANGRKEPLPLGSVDGKSTVRENARILYGSILRIPLDKQSNIFAEKMQRQAYHQGVDSQYGYGSPHQASNRGNGNNINQTDTNDEDKSFLFLAMFESMIFNFLRFGISRAATQVVYAHQNGMTPYSDSAYTYLYRSYIRYLLPRSTPNKSLSQMSEFFLRSIIEFWIDGQNEYIPVSNDAKKSMESLSTAFDNVYTKSPFRAPRSAILRKIRELVSYLMCDSGLHESVSDSIHVWSLPPALALLQQPLFNFIRSSLRFAPIHSGMSFHSALSIWLLLLEPWNKIFHVKGSIQSAGKHARDIALQKLNTFGIHGSGKSKDDSIFLMPDARYNSPSKFTKKWEPYIISNIHIYTTILAIFLRRSREFDFSPQAFSGSLHIVQRVIRVFTPEVVAVISKVSKNPLEFNLFNLHRKNLGLFSPGGSFAFSDCTKDIKMLLEEVCIQHMRNMDRLSFFSKIEDKIEGIFNGNAGSKGIKASIKRLAEDVKRLLNLPADYDILPAFNSKRSSSLQQDMGIGSMSISRPDRDPKTGLTLTQKGSDQVLMGTRQCSPLDIPTLGDPLRNPVIGSYEIPFLVNITINVSDWLNEKLGFFVPSTLYKEKTESWDSVRDPSLIADALLIKNILVAEEIHSLSFRFNLRFLADWRNLLLNVWILIIAKVAYKIFH